MSKKAKDYEIIRARIAELKAKAKEKKITTEESIELAEERESLRRHEAAERIKAAKAALAEGKKAALMKILNKNGIKTENDLKDILRFIQEVKPELIPARREATETPKEDGDEGKGDGGTEEQKNESGSEGTYAAESQTGEVPVCEKCGVQVIRKYSKRKEKEYFICPNYSDNDKSHYFQWI